jgi:hypothetical protein
MVKSVRFSGQIEGWYIRYPTEEENCAKSYSSEEYARFHQVLAQDVVKCSLRLVAVGTGASQDRMSSEKNIIRCVGINHLVSRNVQQRYQDVREVRKEHVRLVLEAQRWQRNTSTVNSAYLARVSMVNSQAFKMRSHKVALLSASVQ